MKKLITALLLACGLIITSYPVISHAASKERPVEVNVNGTFISMDVHPTLDNNSLFIPIRSLASLGIHYSYSSSRVTLKNENGEYLKITVGSKVAYKGNQKIQMDQAAKNQDGRVLVPVRFVSEALGYHVDYEPLRQMVFVNSDSYKFDPKQLTQEDLQAARKAAISLPIQFDFKPLDSSGVLHEYSFPVGRADVYMFLDGRNETLVNIKDGKATAVGQIEDIDVGQIGEPGHTSGDIPSNFVFATDPHFEAFQNGNVLFIENRDGTARAVYNDENGKSVELKTNIHVYSDIIQKLPNQQ